MIDLLTAIREKGLKAKDIGLEAGIANPSYLSQIMRSQRSPTPELIRVLNKKGINLIGIANNETDSKPEKKAKTEHTKRDYSQLFNAWIAKLEEKHKSPKTISGYKESVKPLLAKVDLNKATKNDLEHYFYGNMKKSPDDKTGWNEASVNRCISESKAFVNWLEENDLITPNENVMKRINKLSVPKRDKPTAKVGSYLKAMEADTDIEHQLAMTLAFETGMRKAELASAKIDDINWDEHTIKIIGKRNKQRNPMFGEKSEALLKQWLEIKSKRETTRFKGRKEYIFDMGYSGIGIALRKAGKKIGAKINPHSFRRGLTFALLDSGLELNDVKEILGHEDIKTTLIYSNEYGEKQAQKKHVSPLAKIGLPTLETT